MGSFRDNRLPIILDKERHILFSLNAIDQIEDKIGDFADLEIRMAEKGRMKLIKWLFTLLINEGATYTKYLETGSIEGAEILTEEMAGLLLNGANLAEVSTNIAKGFRLASTGTTDPPEDEEEHGDEEGNSKPDKEK